MKGRAFLKVARELQGSATEAHRRTIAGRAYYALMLEARDLLDRWGITSPPRDKLHQFVRLKLLYSSDVGLKRVGTMLERLGKLRNEADHELTDGRHRFDSADSTRNLAQLAADAIADLDGDQVRRDAAIKSM